VSDFSGLAASDAAVLLKQCGDAAVYEPESGPEIQTYAILDRDTDVIGDLGQLLDRRPSVTLDRAVVGDARKGYVRVLGKRFEIGHPVPGGDDGFVVQRYVREVVA
jgi:hypothetical protein